MPAMWEEKCDFQQNLWRKLFFFIKDAYTAASSQTYAQPMCHLSAPRHSNIWEEKSSITTGCDNH